MKKLIYLLFVITNVCSFSQTTQKTKFKSIYEELEETVTHNKLMRPKLNLGFELMRLDKQNVKILLRKYEYPLKLDYSRMGREGNSNLSIYNSKFSIPMEIYNPEKVKYAAKSNKLNKVRFDYELEMIPINKKGNFYSFFIKLDCTVNNVDYSSVVNNGDLDKPYRWTKQPNSYSYSFSKTIELKVGDELKIADSFHPYTWRIEDEIEGKKMIFYGIPDYEDYFNDFFILSLESDK